MRSTCCAYTFLSLASVRRSDQSRVVAGPEL